MSLTDAEWREARRQPLYKAAVTLTPELTTEVGQLGQSIAYGLRDARTRVEQFMAAPMTRAEYYADKAGLDGSAYALATVQSSVELVRKARKSYDRLVQLLGTDATIADHGWAHGLEQISLDTIGAEVEATETLVAPLVALEKAAKAPRRNAA